MEKSKEIRTYELVRQICEFKGILEKDEECTPEEMLKMHEDNIREEERRDNALNCVMLFAVGLMLGFLFAGGGALLRGLVE